MKHFQAIGSALILAAPGGADAAGLAERLAGRHQAFLEDRRSALPGLSDPYGVPEPARPVLETVRPRSTAAWAWRRNVTATVFWVGEEATANNPTPNDRSAWDGNWVANFGGTDDPIRRHGWYPAGFVPNLNPFYAALPYNDIARGGGHRPEAAEVIPWFWERYRGDGVSVCKGRWLAIHHQGKVCYAQWEDVGPFVTDHWEYVFGSAPPRPNRNGNAGLDISPAVRDYLGMKGKDLVEWRFVEDHEVPQGPWFHQSPVPPLPD